ncbi:uncharacterized protein LOC114309696 [Camellia sinensis]|uniref:uncharacterized protein LOC114309696 n=1 Tax=Camellia sinensis TaxID=4442 RepID=UPI001036E8C1|nr:uncharacterized protein LOC114309696 [Camellia sinensis]
MVYILPRKFKADPKQKRSPSIEEWVKSDEEISISDIEMVDGIDFEEIMEMEDDEGKQQEVETPKELKEFEVLESLTTKAQDPLEEVNLEGKVASIPTFISSWMDPISKVRLLPLLKEYKDYFAWDYSELPGLDRQYVEWLSNVVPATKKNGKIRVYIDFRNLNLATPKDEYPMPMVDLLVDISARRAILSMMDGHFEYN